MIICIRLHFNGTIKACPPFITMLYMFWRFAHTVKGARASRLVLKLIRQQEVEEYVQKEGCQLNRTSDTHKIRKLKLCIQQKIGKNMWSILGMLLDSGNVDYVVGVV